MIENTNLKNDMAHPFSRRNMIMPPASVEQAMDAEGIEAGTVVTIDGVKYEGGPLNLALENKNVQLPVSVGNASRQHFCEDDNNIYYVNNNTNSFGYIDENNNVHVFTSSIPKLHSITVIGNDVYVFGSRSINDSFINKHEIYHKNDLSTLVGSHINNLNSYYAKGFEYNNTKYIMSAGTYSGYSSLYSIDGDTLTQISLTWGEGVSSGNKYFVDFKIIDGKLYGCYNHYMNVIDLETMNVSQYTASVLEGAFSGDAAMYVEGSNIKIIPALDNITNHAQVFDLSTSSFISSEQLPSELRHCWMGVLYTNIGKYITLSSFNTVTDTAAKRDHSTVNFKDGVMCVIMVVDNDDKFANVTQTSFKEV